LQTLDLHHDEGNSSIIIIITIIIIIRMEVHQLYDPEVYDRRWQNGRQQNPVTNPSRLTRTEQKFKFLAVIV